MAKRWKKEEITYLRRYAKKRTLLELADRFRIEADAIETKLSELELQTSDGMGKLNLAEDPVVIIYEKGVKAVHAKKWAESRKHFTKVIADADMVDLKHRGEQYLALVERESGAEGDPRDPYLKAVLEHNKGNFDAVEAACKREGRLNSDERYAYLAAAVAAVREDFESAMERLTVAIELNPRNLIQARQDTDFAELRETPEFAELDV
jgi:tetratricopeptide (TPR) repeat protein